MATIAARPTGRVTRDAIPLTWRSPIIAFGLFLVGYHLVLTLTMRVRASTERSVDLATALAVIWIVMVFARYRPQFRYPIAAYLLLAMQVWGLVCLVVANELISKPIQFVDQLHLYLNYFVCFSLSALLVNLVAESRKYLQVILFTVVGVSCFVGYLQLMHFGPALAIQRAYFGVFSDIQQRATAIGQFRISGLTAGQSILAVNAAVCFLLIGARIWIRPLKAWEVVLAGYFAFAALFTQTRALVGPMVLCAAFLLVLNVVRNGNKGALQSLIFTGLSLLPFGTGIVRLNYLTASPADSGTMIFRREVVWPQADNILRYLPWTGIGPDWRFSGLSPLKRHRYTDKWVPLGAFDSSTLHTVATLGYPGAILLGLSYLTAMGGCVLVLKSKAETDERKVYVLAALLILFCFLPVMFLFSNLYWKEAMWPMLIALGLACATRQEVVESVRKQGKYAKVPWMRRGRFARVFNGPEPEPKAR